MVSSWMFVLVLIGCFLPCAMSLWPMPTAVEWGNSSLQLDEKTFSFRATQHSSAVLVEAFARYNERIFARYGTAGNIDNDWLHAGVEALLVLDVRVTSANETLQVGADESYELVVASSATATLTAPTVWGALRGLETFSQLVDAESKQIAAAPIRIRDAPRFTHRGLMLDCARHFLPMSTLSTMLDAMETNKLNVLHLHLSDDQSVAFQSESLPLLARGAFSPSATLSRAQLRQLVQLAHNRGIRVLPEFDTPSHALSFRAGYPHLFSCENGNVLDPTQESTFVFVEKLLSEITTVFPDDYMHLGGDEVSFGCWNESVHVREWMETHGMAPGDYKALVRYYLWRLQEIAQRMGKKSIHWQEVFDHYGTSKSNPTGPPAFLSHSTVLQMWLWPSWNWANMTNVAEMGFYGVKSDHWYLNDQTVSWQEMYVQDPLTNGTCNYTSGECVCAPCFNITDARAIARVLGGEACAWGEQISADNLMTVVWPRSSAVAERLWSGKQWNDPTEAQLRLEPFVCHLKQRGVPVAPLQPGYCPVQLTKDEL